ncbi:MAG TPA: hypothetical protein VNO83_06220 [Pseudonocardia sp.]|nr:hypothetical protein [Pseudonocardia sp.]
MGKPDVLLRLNGSAICAGVERMIVPQGGAHVRAAEIRIPAAFTQRPTVTATCHARSGPGTIGAVFGVFNIKVNRLSDDETQVAIQATNVQSGVPVEGDFDCDYVIIGELA